MMCKALDISAYRISWLIFSIYVSLFIGHAIELSSKYFTQIHYLFILLRKSNNAVKFIVSLKQNRSEGFTTNGFSKILSSLLRHELQYLENMLYKVSTADCL